MAGFARFRLVRAHYRLEAADASQHRQIEVRVAGWILVRQDDFLVNACFDDTE